MGSGADHLFKSSPRHTAAPHRAGTVRAGLVTNINSHTCTEITMSHLFYSGCTAKGAEQIKINMSVAVFSAM